MSWESTASDVSARCLDLNSVAVVHQAELEGSGGTGKSDGDSAARDDLSRGDREEDKNVSEVDEKDGNGKDIQLGAKFAGFTQEDWNKGEETPNPTATTLDSNTDLTGKADTSKGDDADKSDANHLQGDTILVSEELFSNDNDFDVFFKKDDSFGEVDDAPKSEQAGETLDVELLNYVDNKQLQSEELGRKSEFSVCDMVWGKVRSHPWWPGQIYDPSFASDMALKHQKKDHFLVAYFGDKTFAWNDKSRLKPFESFFSQMEKQSSLDEFVNAVDVALEEVARRIEIGMTCGCVADEFIAGLKHQMIENAGIKEGTCCPTLDRCAVASSFDPGRLLDYIHELARLPCGNFDKLELVKVTAQVKAIYMSKGYSELPEFCFGGGLSHSEDSSVHEREEAGQDDAEFKKNGILSNYTSSKEKRRGRGRPPGKKNDIDEDSRKIENKMDETLSNDSSSKEKRRGRGRPPGKKKSIEEDGRKQRSLPELMRETADPTALNGTNVKNGAKASSKSSIKKRKISYPDSVDSGKRKKRRLNSLGDIGSISDSSSDVKALKIGQRISRVANEMKFSCSEHSNIKLQKGKSKTNGRTSSVHGDSKSPKKDASFMQDYPTPSEMLSQLCFAAKSPTKAHRFQSSAVGFFVNWRDSHAPDSLDDDKLLNLPESRRGRKKLAESELVSVEVKSDYLQDSYWSDVIFEENPKKEVSSRGRKRKASSELNQTKKSKPAGISSVSSPLEITLNASEHLFDGSAILIDKQQQEERLLNLSDEKTVEECNPAALILSFNDPNSLPSESDLIKIFSQYGPLKEAETEVSKKSRRASVMFKRGVDAEVAFSSSGKFSAFGPNLVSYRLRYLTSSSPVTTPTMDSSPTKEGASILPEDSGEVPTDEKA
ncbi:hypothetical protein KFK09_020647 [Dendrobium nobile]|uniref:PWWP domain-containing protein n=1 Tax=Dendrobium nobile TaxID=94219 RepID=A0A8T3AMA5_DENNO|nr:hypothetical protein KFK09_020647 [Dendrobium nobile]